MKMDCINKKNSHSLCSILLLISSSFICCQGNEYESKYKTFEEASRIVREKCNEYTKEIHKKHNINSQSGKSPSCNTSKPYNVRDMNAEKGEFPHMARIGYMGNNEMEWSCGGSLISEKFVLSSAACATFLETPASAVLLGAENFLSTHENTNAAYYAIEKTFVHPEYYSHKMNNDIALFKLNDTVEFNAYIRPICLSTLSLSLRTHRTAVVSGYGRRNTAVRKTGELMKTNVTIFDNERCISHLSKSTHLYPLGINKDRILCAGSYGDNGKYVCYGDAGGPLQTLNDECLWEQHGIISVGPTMCSDKMYPESIYTRVSYYIDWIESIVWSSNE